MDSDQQRQEEESSASLQGILGCIEVGLAHLTPEQRRLWEADADLALLFPSLDGRQEEGGDS